MMTWFWSENEPLVSLYIITSSNTQCDSMNIIKSSNAESCAWSEIAVSSQGTG